MTRTRGQSLAILAVLLSPMMASAVPIQLSEAQFGSHVAGLPSQVEDFESYPAAFPVADQASPFVFLNGSFTTAGTISINGTPLFCGTAGDQCLIDRNETTGIRSFFGLPAGTTHWGATLQYIDLSDLINVVVTGGSGVLDITEAGTSFLGFYDPLGITSIAFENLGTHSGGNTSIGNYAFDDIITAQVPEPSTFALFCVGLAGLILRGRSGRSGPRPLQRRRG